MRQKSDISKEAIFSLESVNKTLYMKCATTNLIRTTFYWKYKISTPPFKCVKA